MVRSSKSIVRGLAISAAIVALLTINLSASANRDPAQLMTMDHVLMRADFIGRVTVESADFPSAPGAV